MEFFEIYLFGLLVVIVLMTALWFVSVLIKNASIVDVFWGAGFVVIGLFYSIATDDFSLRKIILVTLLTIWGLRLSFFIGVRNWGKGEDFRYKNFRKSYGEHRYWWVSYFQTFVLQGLLIWLVSAPLLAVQFFTQNTQLGILDFLAIAIWMIGFSFEAGGDFQLYRFKKNLTNRGKVLDRGFWKYTRHPNYFGDAAVWWAFGLFSVAAGSYLPLLSALLMTLLLLKVSGVVLLERTLRETKPGYREYIEKTSSFFPWFPLKTK